VKVGGLGIRSAAMLAKSACLHRLRALPNSKLEVYHYQCPSFRIDQSKRISPSGQKSHQHLFQPAWQLESKGTGMLLARISSKKRTAGCCKWQARPSTDNSDCRSLHLVYVYNEAVCKHVRIKIGVKVCEEHKWPCDVIVDSKGTHWLSCRSASRQQQHSQLNYIMWRGLI